MYFKSLYAFSNKNFLDRGVSMKLNNLMVERKFYAGLLDI